jgi:predicted 3-demethylubiquinone-9 3-methyltransferase (glyoxalase superfamily)
MPRITPFLWFDNQAEEAANFYISLFKNSKIVTLTRWGEAGPGPRGSVLTVGFELAGQEFIALNGGPQFKFNPSISFFVICETEAEVDALWQKLSEAGSTLMELQKYDWSEKYGWLSDRYGLSWQICLGKLSDVGQKITPSLLFVGKQHGRAEEAIRFYTSVFEPSSLAGILRYGPGEGEPEGTVKHAQFVLEGCVFMVMENSFAHGFTFNEAVSFAVDCKDQSEVDAFWEKLSAGGEEGRCGWLKDKFGLSWQVTPAILPQLLNDPDRAKADRALLAMLQMKKFDIEKLKAASEGR